ncbi:MAG: hypothetical protein IJL25_04105 [Clostridia bacterium]|nr:hypothetical protein [Clostridia bacterium]
MKKTVSVFLSLLLVFLGCVPALAAGASGGAVPTVYIVGGNGGLKNAEGEMVLPIETPEGYLGEAVKDCAADLAKALVLRTPEAKEAYKEKLISWMAPIYEKVVLDRSGDPIGEYVVTNGWSADPFVIPEVMPDYKTGDGYDLRSYEFYYDWRLDPFVNADRLEAYINAILRGTGVEKVNLLGRCEGGTILMAYLSAYGHEKVNKVFFNTTASNGYILATAAFSGEMEFSSADINRFLKNNPNFSLDDLDLSSLSMGDDLLALLKAMLDASSASPGIDLTGRLLDRFYTDLIREILPDVLLVSYGTFPAVWAMVDNDHFDAALSYVFAGREAEYAGLIERIVYYHENVSLKTEELLRACEADGVEVGTVTKYGYPAMPLYKESDLLSDGHALVRDVSFGATASTHTGALDEKYINRRVSEGKGKYISADKKIDASTGMFPDTSWYIGNLEHQYFPYLIDDLTQAFFVSDGMTVDTDPAYPQFMVFNEEYRLDPLTEENADRSVVGVGNEPTFSNSLERFADAFGSILIKLITFVRSIITGIVDHAKGNA